MFLRFYPRDSEEGGTAMIQTEYDTHLRQWEWAILTQRMWSL